MGVALVVAAVGILTELFTGVAQERRCRVGSIAVNTHLPMPMKYTTQKQAVINEPKLGALYIGFLVLVLIYVVA